MVDGPTGEEQTQRDTYPSKLRNSLKGEPTYRERDGQTNQKLIMMENERKTGNEILGGGKEGDDYRGATVCSRQEKGKGETPPS